jgi:hypothetical protein
MAILTKKEENMKNAFLPVLAVLLVLFGAAFRSAAGQELDQRTEAQRAAEEDYDKVERIRAGLVAYPTEQELALLEKNYHAFRGRRAELAFAKALEDIAANIPLLLVLKKDFGESALFWWAAPIAEKLPSQPVAVIQLMVNIADWNTAEQYINHMCPMWVVENGIDFVQYENWLERSIAALESFTMTDARAEQMRNRCLRQIRDALATANPWVRE